MADQRPSRRSAALVALVAGGAALATIAPRSSTLVAGPIRAGVTVVSDVAERSQSAPLAPTGSYDPDRIDDKLNQYRQAAALPVSMADTKWRDVGPLGVDSTNNSGSSTEEFGRVAGMGAALAADSNDPSGNTVYLGNMGGLWKSSDGGDHWRNLSDGKLDTAAVGAIALDPSRPNDLYVGTGIAYLTLSGDAYGTGFYVSHDGGRTFSRPNPNISGGWAVTRIVVTPGALLIGTNHGLYRSTDHGDTLTPIPLPTNADHSGPATGPYGNWVSDIAVRPGAPNEVTVAVGFALGKVQLADGSTASPGNGLYRSMTGGTAGSFTALDVSGLSTPQSSADPVGRISLAYGQTASDNGVLWALVSDAGLSAGGGISSVSQIADNVGNPTASTLNGLFRSGDDGTTWTWKVNPSTLLTAPNSTLVGTANPVFNYAPGVQADYEVPLATDPNNADQVYFGLEEAYATAANSGGNPGPAAAVTIERYADVCGFYSSTPPYTNGVTCPDPTPYYGGKSTHPDQHALIAVKTPNGTRLYSANDGGAWRQDSHSTADGTGFDNSSWTALNALPTLEPWHVVMLSDGSILTALQDNGASLNGADRQGMQVGLGDGYWVFPTTDPNTFYIGIPGALLFVTKDRGQTLRPMQPSLSNAKFTSPIAIDPTDPNHIVAAARNVQETLNGPNTQVVQDPELVHQFSSDWVTSYDAGSSNIDDPFTGNPVDWTATALDVRGAAIYGALCATCSAFREQFDTVSPTIETNVQPGCTPKEQAKDCWHLAASKGLGAGYINSVVIDPADTKTIYAAVMERQFIGYPGSKVPGRVYVSHDAGENFTDITGNLPRGSVWRMVIRDGQLIAGTDAGVFTTPLGSTSWSRLGSGLPRTMVRDVWLDPSGRYLLVSAYGRGAWMLDFGAGATGSGGPGVTASATGTGSPSSAPAAASALPDTAGGGVSLPAQVGALLLILAGTLGLRRRARRRT